MSWKNYIPKEEHHKYEDNDFNETESLQEEFYPEDEIPHLAEVGDFKEYEQIINQQEQKKYEQTIHKPNKKEEKNTNDYEISIFSQKTNKPFEILEERIKRIFNKDIRIKETYINKTLDTYNNSKIKNKELRIIHALNKTHELLTKEENKKYQNP